MVNKPKKQGTTFETLQVNLINKYNIHHKARRLAEGGNKDEGDVEFFRVDYMLPNERWVMEAKNRQALTPCKRSRARQQSSWPRTDGASSHPSNLRTCVSLRRSG